MRFLFSDVRNDAALEAAGDENIPEGEFRMSLQQYVEAVEALTKVAEAAHDVTAQLSEDEPPYLSLLREALDAFDFEAVQ